MNRLAFATLTLLACSTDTFVGTDAGSDSPAEATAPDACPPAHVCAANQICLDFDNTTSYSPFLDSSKNGGKVEISSDQYVTCPHSLLATVGPATATNPPVGSLGAIIPVQPDSSATAHLEADIILPTNAPGAAMYLALAPNADGTSVVALAWAAGGWVLWVQASTNGVAIEPRVGAWNHIALDVIFSSSGGTGKATLSYTDHNGDAKSVQISDGTMQGSISTVTSVVGGVGIQATAASAAGVSAYYDDVSFGAQ